MSCDTNGHGRFPLDLLGASRSRWPPGPGPPQEPGAAGPFSVLGGADKASGDGQSGKREQARRRDTMGGWCMSADDLLDGLRALDADQLLVQAA
jgi:hypothetical protein